MEKVFYSAWLAENLERLTVADIEKAAIKKFGGKKQVDISPILRRYWETKKQRRVLYVMTEKNGV